MKRKALTAFAVIGSLALVAPVYAHHAFAAEFDEHKPITLMGTVKKVEWANPHSRFYLDVNGGRGMLWELVLGSPNGLVRQGWNRNSLKQGDVVTVNGYLAKDGAHLASARSITFADGHSIPLGPLGDGGPVK